MIFGGTDCDVLNTKNLPKKMQCRIPCRGISTIRMKTFEMDYDSAHWTNYHCDKPNKLKKCNSQSFVLRSHYLKCVLHLYQIKRPESTTFSSAEVYLISRMCQAVSKRQDPEDFSRFSAGAKFFPGQLRWRPD